MDEEQRARVDSLLEEALARTDLERDAFLAVVLGEDQEVGREVSSLLRCHEQAGPFLETPIRGFSGVGTDVSVFARGEVVSDRFRIVELRDRGGMGEVYEAFDLELGERVALKTIRPELAWDEKVVERFRREALLARRVTHRNVCRIHDVFHVRREESEDVLFLTMEYLEGENLASYRSRQGRIDWREAIPILSQILSGLEAACSVGVLHRDLKAENVMLVPEAEGTRAVVTDFGLAALADGESSGRGPEWRASSRSSLGTPAYMSPEQLDGSPVDHRSDIYAVGVIAYEMLSGEFPYPIVSGTGTLRQRFGSKPRGLREFQRRIPREFERSILQSLEVKPSARPAGASELRRKLQAIPTEVPARRVALVAAASAAGAAFALIKVGPPVLELLERWTLGPRALPLEEYVDSPLALEELRKGIARVLDGANLEAIQHFEVAVARDADSIIAHAELIESLLDVGEWNRAAKTLAHLDEIRAMPRDSTETHMLRSVRTRVAEQYDLSAEARRALSGLHRDDVHLLLREARLLEDSGKFLEVLPRYEAISSASFAASLGLGRALAMVGKPERAIELVEANARSASPGNEALGMVHSILGMTFYDMGEFPSAVRHQELSLYHREKAGDRRGQAASLANLAAGYSRLGKFSQSRVLLDRALRLVREMGDRSYESYALGRIGWLHLMRGDPAVALRFFREGLAIESALEDHGMLGARLNGMAHANVFLGFLDDGLMNLSEALKHIAPSGQTDQLAYNHLIRGSIAATRGEYKHSDDDYGKAIELYRVARMPHEVAWVRCCLVESQCLRGQYWKAALNLEEASDFLETRTDQLAVARVEVHEASLAVSLGAYQDAERALARAKSLIGGSGYWEAGLQSLHVRGALSLALSRFQEAVEELTFAMSASAQSGFKEQEVLLQTMLGQALTCLGESGEARTTLLAALATSKRLGFRGVETIAALAMSQLFYQSDDLESAIRASGEAVALAKSMSIEPVVFRGSVVLGDALFKLGRSQKAADAYREAHGVHQSLLANVAPSCRQTYIASPDINACLERITDGLA